MQLTLSLMQQQFVGLYVDQALRLESVQTSFSLLHPTPQPPLTHFRVPQLTFQIGGVRHLHFERCGLRLERNKHAFEFIHTLPA